jgi:hypothetical protein
MAKPTRERLWIDDQAPPPAGWRAVQDAAEAGRWLRSRRVDAVALGSPPELALAVAQLLEQGAFTGTLPRLAVEQRLAEGAEREMVAAAVAAAGRHWDAVPLRPAAEPAVKRPPRPLLVRFLFWHVVGFAVAILLVEGWCLWQKREHAPIVASALRLVGLAPPEPVAQPGRPGVMQPRR